MSQGKSNLCSRIVCIFGIRFHITPCIVTFFMICILLTLGAWQLNRLEYKNALIKSIEDSITSDPQMYDNSLQDIDPYKKLTLKGKFLSKQTIFVYGQRSAFREKNGYYVLTPFQTINNDIILVARYWIPYQIKPVILDNLIEDKTDTEIVGITLPGEKKSLFAPNNDIQQRIWFTIDLHEASKILGVNVNHIYLLGIDIPDIINGAAPLYATHLNKIRNDHLEYAITWFALAISLLIIYMIWEYNNSSLMHYKHKNSGSYNKNKK